MSLQNPNMYEKSRICSSGLILCLLCSGLVGCTSPQFEEAWTTTDPSRLEKIAVESQDTTARHVAVEKLKNPAVLEKIAVSDRAWYVRLAAVENTALQNRTLLARIAGNDEEFNVRRAADSRLGRDSLPAVFGLTTTPLEKVARTTDQAALKKIALEDKDNEVRAAAADKLVDQALLAKFAREDSAFQVRAAATGKLTDQALLAKIASSDPNSTVRCASVGKITDQALLAKLAIEDSAFLVREAAGRKVTDPALLAKIAAECKYPPPLEEGLVENKNSGPNPIQQGIQQQIDLRQTQRAQEDMRKTFQLRRQYENSMKH